MKLHSPCKGVTLEMSYGLAESKYHLNVCNAAIISETFKELNASLDLYDSSASNVILTVDWT